MCVYLTNVPCITIIICMYLFSSVACKCKPDIFDISCQRESTLQITANFIAAKNDNF